MYKACAKTDGVYHSLFSNLGDKNCVIYNQNQWTEAPGNTRLFCFECYSDVLDFFNSSDLNASDVYIFECEVDDYEFGSSSLFIENINYFWDVFNTNPKNIDKLIETNSTIFCLAKRIKITNDVTEYVKQNLLSRKLA